MENEFDILEFIKPYAAEGEELMHSFGKVIVSSDRIRTLHEKYAMLPNWLDEVCNAADEISQNEELVRFCYTVYAVLKDEKVYKANRTKLNWEALCPDFIGFAPIFPVLYFTERMVIEMMRRDLPQGVINATLLEYDTKITDHYKIKKEPGFMYMDWLSNFVYGNIIRIDRFNIEIKKFDGRVRFYKKADDIKLLVDGAEVHKKGLLFPSENQDDEANAYMADIEERDGAYIGYTADEDGFVIDKKVCLEGYEEILRDGDDVLAVHIPAGMSLDNQYCQTSLDRAIKLINEYYSELSPKAFVCVSWMASNQTRRILGKESNVTRFADMFIKYPVRSKGEGIYSFVFNTSADTPADELPENTSMQREFKKYIKNGGVFYESGAVRFI